MDFRFGLETEYLISNAKNFEVYWHDKLHFNELHDLFLNISLDHVPSLEGLDSEPAHREILPFVVEGYHLKNEQFLAIDMHPKGIEIRSPVCNSIDECLLVQKLLYKRLCLELKKKNLSLSILSHHPWAFQYNGPRSDRPLHFWQWAKRAMLTYGPDVNISWHTKKGKQLFEKKEEFEKKLNYYAPALVALSAFSPFYKNQLARDPDEGIMRSVRTYYRSEVAPLIEWHENENFRMEFKFFDMALSWEEYAMFFELCLSLLLCDQLNKHSTKEKGMADLKMAATIGTDSPDLMDRALELINQGLVTLPEHDLSCNHLLMARRRAEKKYSPSDFLIRAYNNGLKMEQIIEALSIHYEKESDWIKVFDHSLVHGSLSEQFEDRPGP